MFHGMLNFRSTQEAQETAIRKASAIGAKDLYMVFDAGKAGNHAAMANALSSVNHINGRKERLATCVPNKLQIIYEQKSVEARSARVAGVMNLQEDQTLFMHAAIGYKHVVKDRLFFQCDTRSSKLYPVKLNEHEGNPVVWRATPHHQRRRPFILTPTFSVLPVPVM